jgi:broad specificity phosphatase PhoE
MSALYLVRHGKASSFSSESDYDRLSEPGFAQSRCLGEHWAARGLIFDAVYVGPRKRHVQTHDVVRDVYAKHRLAWPEPVSLKELDEHDAIGMLFKVLPRLAGEDDVITRIVTGMARGEQPSPTDVLAVFKTVTRRWVRGEVSHDEVEDWTKFRLRVARGLTQMTHGMDRGKKVVAFTSAGAVAAAVGAVLEVSDEMVLDLSWSLHNASVSELAFSDGRWGMRTFNGTAHLTDPALVTSV